MITFLLVITAINTYSQIAQNSWVVSPQAKDNSYFYIQLLINFAKIILALWVTRVLFLSKLYQSIHDDAIKGLLFSSFNYFQNNPIDKVIGILSNDLTINDTIVTFELNYSLVNFLILFTSIAGILYVYLFVQNYYFLIIFIIFSSTAFYFFSVYFNLSIKALRI